MLRDENSSPCNDELRDENSSPCNDELRGENSSPCNDVLRDETLRHVMMCYEMKTLHLTMMSCKTYLKNELDIKKNCICHKIKATLKLM